MAQHQVSGMEMLARGLGLLRIEIGRKQLDRQVHLFQSNFGIHPFHVARVWSDMLTTTIPDAQLNPSKEKPEHMLTALFFLRVYPTEDQKVSPLNLDPKTSRKWQWIFVKKIAALKDLKIVWPNDWGQAVFIMSVDGTHCCINEPRDPVMRKHKKWYSHKNSGPGVNYEVALHLWENRVVHTFFSGPAGESNDITAYRQMLKARIPAGKMIIADHGYRSKFEDEREKIRVSSSLDTDAVREFKNSAKTRQESFNDRLKRFNVLSLKFCHGFNNHPVCFDAVLVLCQYGMEGNYRFSCPLFDV